MLQPFAEDSRVDLSLIADLLSLPREAAESSTPLSSQRRKELTLEALLAWTEGLTAQHPLLLCLEDVHWADPTSLELLHLLVSQAPRMCCVRSRKPR
jgi:predicted ATPase